MVKVRKNLTGKRFGRTIVLRQYEKDHIFPSGRRAAQWVCKCDCGKEHISLGWDLTSGDTTSCGCYRKECEIENLKPHSYKEQFNTYDLTTKEYGIGYTNKGEPFWFDKEDFDLIKSYCWHYNEDGYVCAKDKKSNSIVRLHRIVMEIKEPNIFVDHIKHPPRKENKVDNRKCNLRVVTALENSWNSSISTANTSGVKGVYWKKENQKWQAIIGYKGKQIHLGYFEKFEDAVKARKTAEEKYQKEYSYDVSQI